VAFSKDDLMLTQESDSYRNSIVIRFSSRKQMKEITVFCNQTISDFNQTLEKSEKLVKNLKNL
jgi:hypothetical protein